MVSDAEIINSHGNSLCYNYVTGCISLITFFFLDSVLDVNLNLLKSIYYKNDIFYRVF